MQTQIKKRNTSLFVLVGTILGDGLSGVLVGGLEELTTVEDKLGGGFDFLLADGVTVGLAGEERGLGGDALEEVVDEGVHGLHASLGDADVLVGVGIAGFQDLEDVGTIGLYALGLAGVGLFADGCFHFLGH